MHTLLSIACGLLVSTPAASGSGAGLPEWVRQDHLDQVQRLNRQLAVFKEDTQTRDYYYDAIVPTCYNRAALVLPDDTDAAQILYRRTRALLDELRTI